jgi:hypothetical protein
MTAHVATTHDPLQEREYDVFRCGSCGRALCKITRDALKPGAVIEALCSRCKAKSYVMGSS